MTRTTWPPDGAYLARNARKLCRVMREQRRALQPVRIAVLGGSTTQEAVTFLEVFMLERGLDPIFWQSEYGRYWEDAVLGNEGLASFIPDIVYVHTDIHNLRSLPAPGISQENQTALVEGEFDRFRQMWEGIRAQTKAVIVQNNFTLPEARILGSLDAVDQSGAVRFVDELNLRLANAVRDAGDLLLNDVRYVSARVGLDNWFDPIRWFSYKLSTSAQGSAALAFGISALIAARYGLSKKVLILDLDNTLWGGVIGDDGVENLVLGRETPKAEAYTRFQEYCLLLKRRGVVLAVASKNTDRVAREGFSHPDSILKIEDFASFQANWDPKSESIQNIANELSLGLDSFVFVDDNPAERALVAAQLPMVSVPDVGDDVSRYPEVLDKMQYFEAVSLSREDLARSAQYSDNAKRNELKARFDSYEDYLASLEMTAEAGAFSPIYFERIAQLTNKTNQFNLTTRRYSLPEIREISTAAGFITRYARLSDRFGDNGLISVAIGMVQDEELVMHLWLMSCRVLKRGVELLMLDELAGAAQQRSLKRIRGIYQRTAKNDMVNAHYEKLGFASVEQSNERSEWLLTLDGYVPRNRSIRVEKTISMTG